MAFNTATRVPGLQADGMNQSISLLQNAISNEKSNRLASQDRAGSAIQKKQNILDKNAKNDIIQNTDRNIFNKDIANKQGQLVSDQVNAEYNSLFDDKGLARKSSDIAKQKILADKQKQWLSGKYGVDEGADKPAWMKSMDDNWGKVEDTATGYSDRIYQNMLDSGFSAEEAEAERKVQLAKNAKPAMTKAALEAAKAQSKALQESAKAQAQILKDTGKSITQNTIGSGGKNSIGRSGGLGSKGSGSAFGGLTSNELAKYGLRDEKENPYSIYELYDKAFADDTDDINSKLGNLPTAGYSKRDIGIILSMPGSISGANNDDASINSEAFANNRKKFDLINGSKGGSNSNGGNGLGGGNTSQTSYNTSYAPGTAKAISNVYNDLDRRQQALWNQGNTGQKILLGDKEIRDTFGGGFNLADKQEINKGTKKNKKVLFDEKNIPKEITAKQDIIEKYRNKNSKDILTKTDGEKTEYNPLGLSNNDVDALNFENNRNENVPTSVYKPRPNFMEDPLGWAGSFNMTPKGEGRDTFKTSDTKSERYPKRNNITTEKDLLRESNNRKILDNSKGQAKAKEALKKQYPDLSEAQIEEMLRQANILNPSGNILK